MTKGILSDRHLGQQQVVVAGRKPDSLWSYKVENPLPRLENSLPPDFID